MKKTIFCIVIALLVAQYLFAFPAANSTKQNNSRNFVTEVENGRFIVQEGPATLPAPSLPRPDNLSEEQQKTLLDLVTLTQVLDAALMRYQLRTNEAPNIKTHEIQKLSKFLDIEILFLPPSSTLTYTPEEFSIRHTLSKKQYITLQVKKDAKMGTYGFGEKRCFYVGENPVQKAACTEVCMNRYGYSPRLPQDVKFAVQKTKKGTLYSCIYR